MLHSQHAQSDELGPHSPSDLTLPVKLLTSAIYDGSFWDVVASTSGNWIELIPHMPQIGQ